MSKPWVKCSLVVLLGIWACSTEKGTDPCRPNPCPGDLNRDRCVVTASGLAECRCNPAHSLGPDGCIPNSVCDQNLCSGNGSCEPGIDGLASCSCRIGYRGSRCTECDSGYFKQGTRCELPPRCSSDSCSPHGNCSSATGEIVCQCMTGYAGERCEECDTQNGFHPNSQGTAFTKDPCNAPVAPCQDFNKQICQVDNGRAICLCNPGFHDEGGVCVKDVTCTDRSCSGHGRCGIVDPGKLTCQCETGYAGNSCSQCAESFQDRDGDGRCNPEVCQRQEGANLSGDFRELAGCTKIEGDLFVDLFDSIESLRFLEELTGSLDVRMAKDIENLDALQNLKIVGKSVTIIGNDALTNLAGLKNLTEVGGEIRIASNPKLSGFQGAFQKLTEVKGQLTVSNNQALEEMDGFGQLVRIQGDLRLDGNQALRSLAGFDSLENISGSIFIIQGPKTICGFDRLTFLGKELSIYDSEITTRICGWNSLKQVQGTVWIANNRKLEVFEGFSSLKEIARELSFFLNPNLETFSAMDRLERVGGGVRIQSERLRTLDGLSSLTQIGSGLSISSTKLETLGDPTSKKGLVKLSTVGGVVSLTKNEFLTNLDALSNLTKLSDNLVIQQNQSLKSISALLSLEPTVRDLVITDNPLLPRTEAEALRDTLTSKDWKGGAMIARNQE